MSRIAAVAVALAASTPAFAHPGHLAAEAGHTHWIAAAAFLAAGAIAGGLLVARFAKARARQSAPRKR